jgi:DNA repair photolyase
MDFVPIKGRGASHNPRNRFEALEYQPDPASVDPEAPSPRTVLYRDSSRTIITRNNSPDVPFAASVNPYRGCEHGCVYCADGETPILMGDGSARPLAELQPGDALYGTVRRGFYRRYVRTLVLAHWETRKAAYRVTLEDGTQLTASGDHRFLTQRGWKFVTGTGQGAGRRPHLTTNDKLLGTGGLAERCRVTQEYRRGYLCGIIRGDGHLAIHEYTRRRKNRIGRLDQFRLAMVDEPALLRTSDYLAKFGVETSRFVFQQRRDSRKEILGIRTQRRENFRRISELIAWPSRPSVEWSAGFLAGLFDAEGSYSGGILRISSTDEAIITATAQAMQRLGFAMVLERRDLRPSRPITYVRLRGGLQATLRFFHVAGPVIGRKQDIEGLALKSAVKLGVVSIEPVGTMTLFDITTGTGDFIADGVVSHNCYARPFHEYLGFSAGLDFETKILVKEDAPELLRSELSSRRWEPQVVAVSGVTDPYQPIERRLRVTRRCLEVLAEFRNPVGIVTKNHLVTRDIDVLTELARYDAVAVNVSVTTLNPKLQSVMEPRTSVPARRLAAIEQLAGAGIPVRVMVAPVIPGLTDHEIPAILEAAAQAGATGATYVALRLPHAVAGLFEAWLERHFPERKEKVLNRVRSMRGGRLYRAEFGERMRGEGVFADQIRTLFEAAKRRAGLDRERFELSTAAFRRPDAAPPRRHIGG